MRSHTLVARPLVTLGAIVHVATAQTSAERRAQSLASSLFLEPRAAHEATPDAARATIDWFVRWLEPTTP